MFSSIFNLENAKCFLWFLIQKMFGGYETFFNIFDLENAQNLPSIF
jgi:hypothetical protein